MKLIGQVILAAILIGGSAAVLRAVTMAAFNGTTRLLSPRGTGRSGSRALRAPSPRAAFTAGKTAGRSAAKVIAHPSSSQIRTQARADLRKLREEARLKNWLAGEEHARANGTAGGTATATAPRRTLAQRLRLAPFTPSPASPANGGTRPGADGTSQPAARGNGGPPARPAPPPPASAQPASNGGTPVAAGTSTASAEKLIEGINELYAHAAAGGIHAKREAVKAAHEACVRFAAMSQMLSRTMAEPGSNYGPEITDPCAKAGQHLQAAAMSYSEADAALTTLINMTVGDLAASARQAPHHTELSEAGAR